MFIKANDGWTMLFGVSILIVVLIQGGGRGRGGAHPIVHSVLLD